MQENVEERHSGKEQTEVSMDPQDAAVFQLGTSTAAPIFIDMELNGKLVRMELDTGAAVSLISECTK